MFGNDWQPQGQGPQGLGQMQGPMPQGQMPQGMGMMQHPMMGQMPQQMPQGMPQGGFGGMHPGMMPQGMLPQGFGGNPGMGQMPPMQAPQGLGAAPTPAPMQPHLADGGAAPDDGSAPGDGVAGLINSAVAGRTDRLPMDVKPNSYVIPADVVSGMGQGNTMAGGRILDAMLKNGPHMQAMQAASGGGSQEHFADGGESESTTPIVTAGGEFVCSPDMVAALGGGDVNEGHKLLDQMVLHVRKQVVNQIKDLPGPKR